MLNANGEADLNMINFHLLNHIIDDLDHFGCLEFLDASPFGRFKLHIEGAYRIASQGQSFAVLEPVGVTKIKRDDS